MRIATWNVNSIKARMPVATDWLKSAKPDVVLLQEIKCETDAFPRFEFEALGYKVASAGQKAYNGVAILSHHPIDVILDHLPGDDNDPQARYIEATIEGVRVASVYLPNGNPIDTEKFAYKLAWIKRLHAHAQKLLAEEIPFAFGGDFNVIPSAEDVHDPKGWEKDALYHPKTRAAYRELMSLGLTDAFRAFHPHQKHAYTYWDYSAGAWQMDKGLRIDHILLSPEATDRLASCFIDRTPRGQEKASDHTPVVAMIG
jgi:exodeoxyribonuclease III